MNDTQMLTIAASLVAAMFGLLTAIIGWIGSRAVTRLDTLTEKVGEMAGELHSRINGLDTRLVKVETKLEV